MKTINNAFVYHNTPGTCTVDKFLYTQATHEFILTSVKVYV